MFAVGAQLNYDNLPSGQTRLKDQDGFIQDDDRGPDMFLHIAASQDSDISADSPRNDDKFV